MWPTEIADVPDGAVIVDGGAARLVLGRHTYAFSFDGWKDPVRRPPRGMVDVLTPPTSVAALRGGFRPVLHPSAGAD